MLTVSNVAKAYGSQPLFEQVSLQINRGERLALVGPNGAGKSTLFRLILGDEEPDDGQVSMERRASLGHLAQETAEVDDATVLDLALAISPEMAKARAGLRQPESSEAYHQALHQIAELDGYELEPKAKRILSGLAFREHDFEKPAAKLSGGWIMRAHLARLLVMEPDLLMLDEPTNHLDLESVGWFQQYLQSYPGAILMISHDRAFLNALVDGILELRNRRLHRYRGNYNDFLVERDARRDQHLSAYRNQQKQIDTLQRFADRFRAKASKASQAQSKLREIDRMEKIEAPEDDAPTISIKFPQPARGGQHPIKLTQVHHAYGDLTVYRGIDFSVERGERIVLVGPNGAGKSTLLKLLAGVLPLQQGERLLGHNIRVGYFAQNRVDNLNPRQTVLEEALSIEHPCPEQMTRTVLGSFLFRGDAVFKHVAVLSGGEKTRLALVKQLLDPPNLLLMDEPTTHLDMASIDALTEALNQYQGTLVFISHDVHFIRSIATKTLHISAGNLTLYAGGYDYYLDKSRATSETAGLVAGDQLTDSRPPTSAKDVDAPKQSVFKTKEQKKAEARERQARAEKRKAARKHVDRLEREITSLEERQHTLTNQLEDPNLYSGGGDVMELNRELIAITETLEKLNHTWESAAAELAAIDAE